VNWMDRKSWLTTGVGLIIGMVIYFTVFRGGPAPDETALLPGAEQTAFTFQTDWRAQAEHGGFYQAKAMGLYAERGLDVTLTQGGPGINVPQLLGAKRIDAGMISNSSIALNLVRAEVPAKAVMAVFQKDLQILMTHPRADIASIADMKGKPIMISDASRTAWWPWLEARFGFTQDQIRKYTFNLAPFLSDEDAIQQGYLSSEPYAVERAAGFTPQVFLLADAGYPSYSTLIGVRSDLIEEKPEVVRAFVEASIEGWIHYLYGDPAPGNALILKDNPEMSADQLAQAILKLRALVAGGDAAELGVGAMTAARFEEFHRVMAAQGVYAQDLPVEAAYDLRFVNQGHGQDLLQRLRSGADTAP